MTPPPSAYSPSSHIPWERGIGDMSGIWENGTKQVIGKFPKEGNSVSLMLHVPRRTFSWWQEIEAMDHRMTLPQDCGISHCVFLVGRHSSTWEGIHLQPFYEPQLSWREESVVGHNLRKKGLDSWRKRSKASWGKKVAPRKQEIKQLPDKISARSGEHEQLLWG